MQKLTNPQIDDVERKLGVTLPGLYRKLLVEEGHGNFSDSAEIYDPNIVYGIYESFFDNPKQIFDPYFPFGCHNQTQELWVIDTATERAASIWHEIVPEDWPDEEWLEYADWIERYLDPLFGGK